MSSPARTGWEVINYDEVWGEAADPRWYAIGTHPHRVSLGRNGVPQATVIYALCGAGVAWLGLRLGALGPAAEILATVPGLGGIRPWMLAAAVLAVFAGASALRPNGLRVHVFVPVALSDWTAPRLLHGWRVAEDPGAGWRPEELVVCRWEKRP